jgi:hypothetical protein
MEGEKIVKIRVNSWPKKQGATIQINPAGLKDLPMFDGFAAKNF